MRKFLEHFFTSIWFYNALLLVNFGGTIYGFYWYAGQFAATPLSLWLFVANSPLAVLYFFIVLLLLRRGNRSPLLEGLAYFGLIKHGMWTVVVTSVYQFAGNVYPENYLLLSGHAAMALQAVLFWYYFSLPLSLFQAAAISGWYLFNDFLDYSVGIHPRVDPIISVATIRNLAVGLSMVLAVLFLWTSRKHRENS